MALTESDYVKVLAGTHPCIDEMGWQWLDYCLYWLGIFLEDFEGGGKGTKRIMIRETSASEFPKEDKIT